MPFNSATEKDAKWFRGSSQSIYASAAPASRPSLKISSTDQDQQSLSSASKPQQNTKTPNVDQGEWIGSHDHKRPARSRISVKVGNRNRKTTGIDAVSQSLSSEVADTSHLISQDEAREEGTSRSVPTQPNLLGTAMQSAIANTPLSATHPLPETPLKHEGRNAKRSTLTPATSASDLGLHNVNLRMGSIPKGGLMLDAGGGDPFLPQELQTPGKERFRTSLMDNTQEVPLPQKYDPPIDQMVAKLRLGRSPAVGTQESRWAVKSSESKGATKESVDNLDDDVFVSSKNEPLFEQAKPTPSLLDRMSPAVNTTSEPPKEGRLKKERKRGSRKHERHSGEAESTKAAPASSHVAGSISKNAEATVMSIASGSQSSQTIKSVNEEKEDAMIMLASTSAESTAISSSPESSHAANDTLTSINWADDDDELPDLPEEWTRAAQSIDVNESTPMPNSSPLSDSEPLAVKHDHVSTRRGAKRGGRGRTKKDQNDASMPASRETKGGGLRITGSASRAKGDNASSPPTRKELFPNHKLEGDTSSKVRRSDHGSNGRAEPRTHARPRLAAGGKDAFDRLTRGAISMKSTAKQEIGRNAN